MPRRNHRLRERFLARVKLLRAEKRSKVITAKSTTAITRYSIRKAMSSIPVRVVRNSLILTLLVWVSGALPSTVLSSQYSQRQSSHYSLSAFSSPVSTVSSISQEAPCTLGDSYQSQPTAACQETYDTHRQTVFLIAALSLQTLLLAAILVLQLRNQ